MNGNEYNNNNNDFRRNDDTSGYMFLNDKYNENSMPEPRNISEAISEMSEIMKGYRQMEQAEKMKNGGKMISNDSYTEACSDPNKTVFTPNQGIKLLTVLAISFACAYIMFAIGKVGWSFGLLYIGMSVILSFKDQRGIRQNLPLANAFLIFGIAMILSDIITGSLAVIAVLFLISLVYIVIKKSAIDSKKDREKRERTTYLIEAVCIRIDKDTESGSNHSSYTVLRPVFEIHYLGMTKRLKSYKRYKNLPYIGERRMIYINPDNFDEWYDPSAN